MESLRGRDFISLKDFSPEELWYLLETAKNLKVQRKRGVDTPHLKGKTLGMIFTKASTRTRVSFEVGMYQLGGYALFLSAEATQIKRGEPIADTARVLSRYLDGIMIRTFKHQDVLDLAAEADIPVINGLTDLLHPCQALADMLTVYEKKGKLRGVKIAYIGDGNNVAHSLLYAAAKFGMEITVASPSHYLPAEEVVKEARMIAAQTQGEIVITSDPQRAAKDAEVIYTDVWASMGQETEREERIKAFQGYQVNTDLLKVAAPGAIIMHCLPAHRGEEITEEVFEGEQSVVFDQAENRLHLQKAILASIL
ncbi:MAG TPA: ornithine carbamoyltransferase [Firmicutes bacterium]|nr:ornithine carbamoyltransferase [Bacillota bacterium]